MATDVSTVGKLREYLDAIESTWTEQSTQVMGEFNLTSVNVWIPYKGYAPAEISADVDGSLILDARVKESP